MIGIVWALGCHFVWVKVKVQRERSGKLSNRGREQERGGYREKSKIQCLSTSELPSVCLSNHQASRCQTSWQKIVPLHTRTLQTSLLKTPPQEKQWYVPSLSNLPGAALMLLVIREVLHLEANLRRVVEWEEFLWSQDWEKRWRGGQVLTQVEWEGRAALCGLPRSNIEWPHQRAWSSWSVERLNTQ